MPLRRLQGVDNGLLAFSARSIHFRTMLSSRFVRKYGAKGLPDDSVTLNFTGSAGQSFGAFL